MCIRDRGTVRAQPAKDRAARPQAEAPAAALERQRRRAVPARWAAVPGASRARARPADARAVPAPEREAAARPARARVEAARAGAVVRTQDAGRVAAKVATTQALVELLPAEVPAARTTTRR